MAAGWADNRRKEEKAMAIKSIYPTFNLPDLITSGLTAEQKTYKQSLYFDYEKGDFRRDAANRLVLATGQEAFEQWCLKQCVTERNTKMAYSSKIGVEIESAVKRETNIIAVESTIQRTITEALMVNPATEYVRNFEFTWDGSDSLKVSFTVKGKAWPEEILLTAYL